MPSLNYSETEAWNKLKLVEKCLGRGEVDSDVKAEIERRLKLLEPKVVSQITVAGADNSFNPWEKENSRTVL